MYIARMPTLALVTFESAMARYTDAQKNVFRAEVSARDGETDEDWLFRAVLRIVRQYMERLVEEEGPQAPCLCYPDHYVEDALQELV
jgi:hypothetical protein